MSKGIFVALFIAIYTAIVFWVSASMVITFQKPNVATEIELWGETYLYEGKEI